MKRSFKKIAILLLMLILAVEVTTVSQEVSVSAASTRTVKNRAKTAYNSYVRKYLSTSSYPYGQSKLYDINRDGIPEMIFTYAAGVRSGYKIYTYKNGKIIKMLDVTGAGGIYRNAPKKQIYISFSGGAAYSWVTCYKMKGQKLVKVRDYRSTSEFKGTQIQF